MYCTYNEQIFFSSEFNFLRLILLMSNWVGNWKIIQWKNLKYCSNIGQEVSKIGLNKQKNISVSRYSHTNSPWTFFLTQFAVFLTPESALKMIRLTCMRMQQFLLIWPLLWPSKTEFLKFQLILQVGGMCILCIRIKRIFPTNEFGPFTYRWLRNANRWKKSNVIYHLYHFSLEYIHYCQPGWIISNQNVKLWWQSEEYWNKVELVQNWKK